MTRDLLPILQQHVENINRLQLETIWTQELKCQRGKTLYSAAILGVFATDDRSSDRPTCWHCDYYGHANKDSVFIQLLQSFKCSYDHFKLKFYRTFNALYSRSKASSSELVCLGLFKSYCLSFLLYAVESTGRQFVCWRCIDSAVMKIFKLTSFENTAFMRMCVGLSDVGIVIKNRFLKLH